MQRRQCSFQQRHLGIGAGQFRRRATAGRDQALGDRAAALLQLQRMLGHVQFVVGVADFQIAVGHLRDHADLGQVARCGDRLLVGTRRFGAALELAEQVELVADRELAIGQVDHR